MNYTNINERQHKGEQKGENYALDIVTATILIIAQHYFMFYCTSCAKIRKDDNAMKVYMYI